MRHPMYDTLPDEKWSGFSLSADSSVEERLTVEQGASAPDDAYVWSDQTPSIWEEPTRPSVRVVLAVEPDPFPSSERPAEGNVVAADGEQGPDSRRAA